MILRLLPVACAVLLTACQATAPVALAAPKASGACLAASGYTARAAAARKAGVPGEILATSAERASVNACMAKRPAGTAPAAPAKAGTPAATRKVAVRRLAEGCNLEMVGGVSYRCADLAIRR